MLFASSILPIIFFLFFLLLLYNSIYHSLIRNGYWKRFLPLKGSCLELKVTRVRSGGYPSQVVPCSMQRMPEVDEAL
jgi:hypothetical protein